ncbi:aminotransferase class I/II-fold pyridoxal phosphate-dependent enzyme [Sphaerotilus sp.]|uniref:aminotransferase class I/II-fold pyridoxal phosphate-dependent enzyme n=1 Tax=Sphaerotilus sp. TaxID=2093942 RepID=UPI0025E5AB71|nr:aminotransferase class I/II-fold pyridoxal phosphate-dependent enzyme [Sphaerotilus sp.]
MTTSIHDRPDGGVQRHGGPDALGVPRWDFSTTANACGPAPVALEQVRQVDVRRRPDPGYTVLRQQLARLHGVEPSRIVLAGSASEFIRRMTLAIALLHPGARVRVPDYAYGEYAAAAEALGLRVVREIDDLDAHDPAWLIWHTEPGSPIGDARTAPPCNPSESVLVIDRAYTPLRLDGDTPPVPDHAWQLWSPNKALGLTGVRGAYAIAPARTPDSSLLTTWLTERLDALAPSWPLGAHGVAMLTCWATEEAQSWVHSSLHILRSWRRQQIELCQKRLGWTCLTSVTPYYIARWGQWSAGEDADSDPLHPSRVLPALRAVGIKLRDCTAMGLPGWVRVSVQPPPSQQALALLWRQTVGDGGFMPTVRQSGFQSLSTY